MYHEDINTARGFLVWLEGRRSFGCICKRCLGRVYEATSSRVGERLRFKVTCNKCRITEHCLFDQRQMTINYELFQKISAIPISYKGVK